MRIFGVAILVDWWRRLV